MKKAVFAFDSRCGKRSVSEELICATCELMRTFPLQNVCSDKKDIKLLKVEAPPKDIVDIFKSNIAPHLLDYSSNPIVLTPRIAFLGLIEYPEISDIPYAIERVIIQSRR